MDENYLKNMLTEYQQGRLMQEDVLAALKRLPFRDLDFAKLDLHRGLRRGQPEVVYCAGKTTAQIVAIMTSLLETNSNVMGTRATFEDFRGLVVAAPDATWHPQARIITVSRQPPPLPEREILVIAAGTSDIPVAEEAAVAASFFGNPVRRIYDVGVAGLHRLLAHLDQIQEAGAIIAVAGMEGAMPTVVAGLSPCPVIAVPTSVGYGANLGGVAALLAMLNSCAGGVGVVNIDNGFGAAALASMINRGRG